MDCMAGIRKGMEQGKFFGCVLDGCMRIEGYRGRVCLQWKQKKPTFDEH